MVTRRNLLRRAASAAALGPLTGLPFNTQPAMAEKMGSISVSAPRVGAQVYVWTQHFARQKQPVSEHLREMLEAHCRAGFRHLELMSSLVTRDLLPQLRRAGDELGIRYPVVYSGARLYESEAHAGELKKFRQLAANAKAIGAEAINCNPDPKPRKEAKSDAELAAEAEGIHAVARLLREEGLVLTLHQHDAEMANDARNWRYWLRETDPAIVRFCFDTHWALRGGQDPLTLLKECRTRLASVHLRNARGRVWWEDLDDGDLDYRPIAQYLKQTTYSGILMVELAWEERTRISRPVEESLRRSRGYVERRFL
ncbi:MAG: sugar phosphate isomerase/epimerase [Bryobacterales bacterium]|nr:sugar phosphate isomerase/epimerase [Bryobacterales bacterium]